ncbi:hypothetical protein [Saccharicrinis carchari]|uniref:hypothetical protein n=1 Tax=Saccharicrinis carchari TaxID=1168039 RepID=UPI00115AFC25|nr:hypothetical protein [Saccharicrinis carchari]
MRKYENCAIGCTYNSCQGLEKAAIFALNAFEIAFLNDTGDYPVTNPFTGVAPEATGKALSATMPITIAVRTSEMAYFVVKLVF